MLLSAAEAGSKRDGQIDGIDRSSATSRRYARMCRVCCDWRLGINEVVQPDAPTCCYMQSRKLGGVARL